MPLPASQEAAAEPLVWQRKLKDMYGLSVRGPVPSAYKVCFGLWIFSLVVLLTLLLAF